MNKIAIIIIQIFIYVCFLLQSNIAVVSNFPRSLLNPVHMMNFWFVIHSEL